MSASLRFCQPGSQRFSRWILAPGWAGSLLLLTFYPLFPHFFDRYQFVPFVVGMVFLGLPHGAQDHLVIPRLRRERATLSFLIKFIGIYAGLVLLYLGFWRLYPTGALLAFLLLSILHWGQGDAYALSVFGGIKSPLLAWGRGLVWIVRGALPIALPSLAFPSVFARVANGIAGRYGGGVAFALTGSARTAGLTVIAVLTVVYLAQSWQANGIGRAFFLDAGETMLLALLFVRVPPVLAVGTYFCLWHALRHFGRLILLDPAACAEVKRGHPAGAFGRAAWDSIPLTAVSLLMLAGLYALEPHRLFSAESATFLYLSLIAALTFPHFLLVLWMDRQQQTFPEKNEAFCR